MYGTVEQRLSDAKKWTNVNERKEGFGLVNPTQMDSFTDMISKHSLNNYIDSPVRGVK